MSGWYYNKTGAFLRDRRIGPHTDYQLIALAYDGELQLDTEVSHERHTCGQWVPLAHIPAAKNRLIRGLQERRQAEVEARIELAFAREAKRRARQQRAQKLFESIIKVGMRIESIMKLALQHEQRQ